MPSAATRGAEPLLVPKSSPHDPGWYCTSIGSTVSSGYTTTPAQPQTQEDCRYVRDYVREIGPPGTTPGGYANDLYITRS